MGTTLEHAQMKVGGALPECACALRMFTKKDSPDFNPQTSV